MIHIKDAQNMLLGDAKVGRNVVITCCDGQYVNPLTKEFKEAHFEILGSYTAERATRYLRRLTGDKSVTINCVNRIERYYSMPLNRFINQASTTIQKDKY